MITRTCDKCGVTIFGDNNAPGDYYELRITLVKKTPFGSDLKEQGTRLDYCLGCAPKQWKKVQDALDK